MTALADLQGDSPAIRAVRERVDQLLAHQRDGHRLPSILLQGETGTGKGLLARIVHRAGARPDGPFVDVNCAAIPETLLEGEMFGWERGAFTDARRAKAGLFQAAHRGTILLDEVGLLSDALQAKLLKVLEERTVRRLGSTRDEPLDVWVLTATNEDLRAAIAERRFREDLYQRLAVVTIVLPPLRERGDDILRLAEHFLARACADYRVVPRRLTPGARARLLAYAWPGNVRELANVMERLALLAGTSEITADMLGLHDVRVAPLPAPAAAAPAGEVSLDAAMREHLLHVLAQTRWNISRSAALLGISRNTLKARIERYGLRGGGDTPRASARSRIVAAPPASAAPRVAALPLRWESRRLALVRAVLVPIGAPSATLPASRALELLLDKVETFGGRLEGVSATGVVAAFGLDPAEDAAERAAHAATAMVNGLDRLRREGLAALSLRVGLHVSPVALGVGRGAAQLDMDDRRALWPLLDELVEHAERDTVLVSEAAAPFLWRRFEIVPVLDATGEPTHRFVLAGRERRGVGPGGHLSQFVGRHHELQLLRMRLDSSMRGQAQIVGVVGAAGMGKSRLLLEFRQSLATTPVAYLETRCHSYASAIPYVPVLDLLRGLCGLGEGEPMAAVEERVHATLDEAGLDRGAAPYLVHLLGGTPGTERLAAQAPNAVKPRVFEALRALVLRRSRQIPVVLVVEDLHWIDATSEEFFAALAETLPGARVLLLTTARPGHRAPWIDLAYATQIALQPLAPEDGLRILRSLLGADQCSTAVVDLILSRAEGNPFFIEELARALRDQGGVGSGLVVPDTIHDVLLARIDRLADDDRRVLRIAAVLGKEISVPLLAATAGRSAADVESALARLGDADFLSPRPGGAEGEYVFRHTLTHDAVYGSLAALERTALHARVVAALEALPAADEHLERLAYHAFAGALWDKAVAYLRRAAARAASRSANREAVAALEQALEAVEHLPPGRATTEQAVDVRLALRASLLPLGEIQRIVGLMREAEALATEAGDRARLGRVWTNLTNAFMIEGEYGEALDYGKRAQALAASVDDAGLQLQSNLRVAQVYHALAQYPRAREILERTVEAVKGPLAHETFGLPLLFSVGARGWLVRPLAEVGDFPEAVARAEEALQIAEEAGHPFSLIVAYWCIGFVRSRKGELAAATGALERAIELCRTWTIPLWFPRVATALGVTLMLAGRVEESLALLRQAVERRPDMPSLGGLRIARLAEGYLAAGRRDEAVRLAERALDLSRAHGERGHEAWTHRLFGEIAARRDPADVPAAEAAYGAAMALAMDLGMRPLLAHCHLGLARLRLRSGDRVEGEAHRGRAAALYAAMGMDFWLAQAGGR